MKTWILIVCIAILSGCSNDEAKMNDDYAQPPAAKHYNGTSTGYTGGDHSKNAEPDNARPTMTLDDTLKKSEIRAFVFLKQEYGLAEDRDIDIVQQSWYPAQKMEVAKWRVITRSGEHVFVVTQTRLTGTDINSFDAYHTWDVKIVNKYRE